MKSQNKIGLLTSLFAGSLVSGATAQTQPVTPTYEKAKSNAEKSRTADFGITLSPFPGGYSYGPWSQSVKSDKIEINANLKKRWNTPIGEEPPTFNWVAELSPVVSAYKHDPTGNAYPYFGADQQYTWALDKEDGILLLDPDPEANAQVQLEQAVAPSTAKKQFRLDFGEGSDEEKWRTNLNATWPKTTTARVGVSGGINSAILPANAKINWDLPYTTVFQVHSRLKLHIPGSMLDPDGETIDFGDVADDDAMEEVSDIFTQINTIDRLKRGTPNILLGAGKQMGLLVVEGVITTAVAGRLVRRAPTNEEVGEVVWERLKPWFARVWDGYRLKNALQVKEGAGLNLTLTVTKIGTRGRVTSIVNKPSLPPAEIPSGFPPTQFPPPVVKPWNIPRVPPFLPPLDFPPVAEPSSGGEETEEPNPNPNPNPNPDVFFVPQPQPEPEPERQPDGHTVERQEETGKYIYYYSPEPDAISDFWSGGGNTQWATGHYYTSLSNGHINGKLTEGETSFSLYGHPYGRPLHGFMVEVTEEERRGLERPDGGFDTRVIRVLYRRDDPFLPTDVITNPDGTTHFREIVPIAYTFKSGIPGAADVPKGVALPRSDGTWTGVPGESTWNATHLEVRRMDAQVHSRTQMRNEVPISFSRGYPDFSPWLILDFTTELELQHGTQKDSEYDFNESDQALAPYLQQQFPTHPLTPFVQNGVPQLGKVRDWRRLYTLPDPNTGLPQSRPLTWHHHENMKTMLLVPSAGLNNTLPGRPGAVPHDGGGKWARNARW